MAGPAPATHPFYQGTTARTGPLQGLGSHVSSGRAVVVLAETSDFALVDRVRTLANLQPVFFAHLLIDLDLARVEPVAAVSFAAGYPVPFAGRGVVVVGLV